MADNRVERIEEVIAKAKLPLRVVNSVDRGRYLPLLILIHHHNLKCICRRGEQEEREEVGA
jgi:hypothetical protein